MIELSLAFLANLKYFFIFMASGTAVFFIVDAIANGAAIDSNPQIEDAKKREFKKRLPKTIAIMIVFSLLACVPDINDLWRIRISLIKYELASPDNVKKATEEIEHLAKKLEEKYLGNR